MIIDDFESQNFAPPLSIFINSYLKKNYRNMSNSHVQWFRNKIWRIYFNQHHKTSFEKKLDWTAKMYFRSSIVEQMTRIITK